jgi:hypothetical protein
MINNSLQYCVGTGSSNTWNPVSGWIDISVAGDNEINLLVTRGGGVGFTVKVGDGTGTYNIDWGDETIITSLTGDDATVRQHQYTTGGVVCSLGYETWKIRIYGASGNITAWKVARHSFLLREQHSPILWAVFNTPGILTFENAFYNATGNAVKSDLLEACTVGPLTACIKMDYMFHYCNNLKSVTFPVTWGAVTTLKNTFNRCTSLQNIILPSNWGNVTDITSMFSYCTGLTGVILPSSWGLIAVLSHTFSYCYSLSEITLPNETISDSPIWNLAAMFIDCWSLRKINNIDKLGTTKWSSSFYGTFDNLESFEDPIHIYGNTEKFSCCGTLNFPNKIHEVRFFGTQQFDGSGIQVDVSYCSMNAQELDILFNDLPTLSGRTILITGNPGSSTCDQTIATGKGWIVTN